MADWAAIKTEYVTGDISQSELSRKYGVSKGSVSKHAKAEQWETDRETYRETIRNLTKQKTAEKISSAESDIAALKAESRRLLWEVTRDRIKGIEDDTEAADVRRYVQNYSDLLSSEPESADSKADESPFELPARVVGEAFVQINRHIKPNMDYIFKGGRGGLKSSNISLLVVDLIKNNPNIHACVVRKVAGTLRDSVFAQIKWAINILGLDDEFSVRVSPLEITHKRTGQTIYFRGCDDPIKLKSIKPPFGYIGILWIEEEDQLNGPEEERSVKQSVLRGGAESYFFASYNPPKSKASWVNKRLLEVNDKRVVHTSSYLQADPEWLGQKFLDDAAHLKEVNPAAYEHEYLGVPNGDGGNVFEYVEVRKITDEEMKRMDRIYQGVDWGWYPDQFAFLRTYYNAAQEKIYLLDELYVNKTPNEQTGQWIINHGYGDYVIICDSAEPKSVNDFRDMGLPARGAAKGPGSVEYGFKWLQRRTLVIDPRRTPNAYREIIEYEYDRDKDGNVISGYPDGNDHAISALRYAYEPLFNKRGTSA